MKEYIIQAVAEETIKQFDELYAPELVRCKDCKYQVDRGRTYKECDIHFLKAKDDWFCADGERRTDGLRLDIE